MKKLLCAMTLAAAAAAGAENWIFAPTTADGMEGVISNSVWTINVHYGASSGLTSKRLTIGKKGSSSYGNALTGRGSGELDFSQPVYDEAGNGGYLLCWINTKAFAFKSSTAGLDLTDQTLRPITKFVFPRSLQTCPADLLWFDDKDDAAKTLKEVILDAPNCTGTIGGNILRRNGGVTNLVLNVPLVKEIRGQTFNTGNMGSSDISKWDISGVETLESAPLAWTSIKGKLYLPKLYNVKSSGLQQIQQINTMEIGTGYRAGDGKTLTVGPQGFINNSGLRKLVFGPYSSFNWTTSVNKDGSTSIALTNAFHGTTSVTNYTFTGPLLTNWRESLDAILYKCASIKSRAADKQAVVYCSRDLGWSAIAVTPGSDELAKKPAWIADEDVMGVYETSDGVKKAWVVNKRLNYGIKFQPWDRRHNDSVEYLEGAPVEGEGFVVGSTVRVRANCGAGRSFGGWISFKNEVPGDDVMEFTVTDDLRLDVKFSNAPNWVYDPAAGTIENELWRLNVTVRDAANKELRIGAGGNSPAYGNALTDKRDDILDMNGAVTALGSGEAWTITAIGKRALAVGAGVNDNRSNTTRDVIVPRTLKYFGQAAFHQSSTSCEMPMLERIVIDAPELQYIESDAFWRLWLVKDVLIKAPQMYSMASQAFNCGELGPWNYEVWDLSGLTTVGSQGFAWKTKAGGGICLPVVTNIGSSAFNQCNASRIELGTALDAKARPVLTFAGANPIGSAQGAKDFVVGPYARIVYPANETDLVLLPKLERVEFMGRPMEDAQKFVDHVLAKTTVPTDGTKKVIIRASRYLGWDRLAVAPTGSEVAQAAAVEADLPLGEELMGVYATAGGERKAWLVHKKSEWDPKGTIMIIR